MAKEFPDPVPSPLDHLTERGEAQAHALILKDKVLTYEALSEHVGRLAAWLAQHGEKGARIATWMAKGELACLMPLATARAGMVHVPVNPLLKRGQVAHILRDSGASLLIATRARLETLEPGDVPADCLQREEKAALADAMQCKTGLGPSSHDPQDIVAILYTSGSTGLPKGVVLSHANLWLGAVSVAHYLELTAQDVTLAVLPLAFDYGQNQLLSTWYAGGCVVPLDYLLPRDVANACARYRISTLAAVPPLWWQLTEIDWSAQAVAPLRRLTNSGGALTPELVRRLRARFPEAHLFPMYGLTEAFRSTFLPPELVATHPTSIGKAVPFAEVMVIDQKGEPSEPGVEGELVHCGPLVAQRYWRDSVRTAERFRPAPKGSVYGGTAVWSGDRVTRDANGLLYFVGRHDAMIKSAGNRISPEEVEQAAMATGLAGEAAAIGVPDERLGQAVELVVRPVEGIKPDTAALARALASALPNYMQPRKIHWMDKLPLTPNGKLDRKRLASGFAT